MSNMEPKLKIDTYASNKCIQLTEDSSKGPEFSKSSKGSQLTNDSSKGPRFNKSSKGSTKDISKGHKLTKDSSKGPQFPKSSKGSQLTKGSSKGLQLTKGSSKGPQLTKDSSKGSQLTKGSSKESQLTKDSLKGPQLTKDTSKGSQLTKDTSKGSQLTKDTSKGSQLTKGSSKESQLTKDSLKGPQLTKDTSKGSQLTKDTSKGSQLTKDTSKGPQISKDSSKDWSMKDEKETVSDGGWGWLVMCATFLLTFMASIPSLSFGILFSKFLMELNATSSTTAWIFNLALVNSGISTILIGPMVDEFGWRCVGLASTIMYGVGFILSAFATSPWFLMFSFSVLVGCNTECLMNLSFVVIPNYFQRWLNIANSVMNSGMCVGQVVMPLVITHLQDEYGFRGAALLTGAICLNGCVAAMTLHPVQWHRKILTVQPPDAHKDYEVDSYPEEHHKNMIDIEKVSGPILDFGVDSKCVIRNKSNHCVMQDNSEFDSQLDVYNRGMSFNTTTVQDFNSGHYERDSSCITSSEREISGVYLNVQDQRKKCTDQEKHFTHKQNIVIPHYSNEWHTTSNNQNNNCMTKGEKTSLLSHTDSWHRKKYSLQNAIHFEREITPLVLNPAMESRVKSINQKTKSNEANHEKTPVCIQENVFSKKKLNENDWQIQNFIKKDIINLTLLSILTKTLSKLAKHIRKTPKTELHKVQQLKFPFRLSKKLSGFAECLGRIKTRTVQNLSYFKSPIIVVLSLILAIPMVVMFNVCTLVPFAMKADGFTQQEASFCLAVSGGCQLFSRLMTGALTWCPQVKIRAVYLAGTCLLFVGIVGFSMPGCGLKLKVITLGLGSIGYGLSMSLYNLLAIEELGIQLMLPCLCITGLVAGILPLVLGVLTGLIRDLSGRYEASLVFCAACVFLSIILGIIIQHKQCLTRKWHGEKEQQKGQHGRGVAVRGNEKVGWKEEEGGRKESEKGGRKEDKGRGEEEMRGGKKGGGKEEGAGGRGRIRINSNLEDDGRK